MVLADASWRGFGHGALGQLAVWWACVCYAWLTNWLPDGFASLAR